LVIGLIIVIAAGSDLDTLLDAWVTFNPVNPTMAARYSPRPPTRRTTHTRGVTSVEAADATPLRFLRTH
jgi:hypothetical protein